ncbi:MAG: folylpolyglutamate synthase/dihydrofolate synthase family protein [Candidatus Bipolaricaulia bacterium]
MNHSSRSPFQTFDDAYAYIAEFTNYERMAHVSYTREAFDLERVRRVLAELDHPDEDYPIVHVAGTKGKGSVCAMVASILRQTGCRVGLFSKPHLVRLNERVSVNGQEIRDDEFVDLMNRLYPYLEDQRQSDNPPTFFDLITILALTHFAQEEVDAVVLEVGLGGRLDSTNVVTPAVSAITTIGYDHTEQLGHTLEQIAREKAGIIKPGVPVVSGVTDSEPADVIRDVAQTQAAPLHELGTDLALDASPDAGRFGIQTWTAEYPDVDLPLVGAHQRRNAAVAVGAVEALGEVEAHSLSRKAVREGLSDLGIRGRIERLSRDPLVILDVAHNPDSLRTLRETLRESYPEINWVVLFGTPADKDVDGNLREVLPLAARVVFTTTDNPRGASPKECRRRAQDIDPMVPSEVVPELEPALHRALALANEGDRGVCIAGWFHMAGEVAKLMSTGEH